MAQTLSAWEAISAIDDLSRLPDVGEGYLNPWHDRLVTTDEANDIVDSCTRNIQCIVGDEVPPELVEETVHDMYNGIPDPDDVDRVVRAIVSHVDPDEADEVAAALADRGFDDMPVGMAQTQTQAQTGADTGHNVVGLADEPDVGGRDGDEIGMEA